MAVIQKKYRKQMLIANVNATKGVAFTLTNRKVAFTSANDYGSVAATIRGALEAESEAGPQAIRGAVRLDCTHPHGILSY